MPDSYGRLFDFAKVGLRPAIISGDGHPSVAVSPSRIPHRGWTSRWGPVKGSLLDLAFTKPDETVVWASAYAFSYEGIQSLRGQLWVITNSAQF